MDDSSVYGIFPTRTAAESAITQLRTEGFSNADVSVLLSSGAEKPELLTQNSTKVPEGAAAGGISGATLGGILGWLAGMGSLAIPGVGPFIAAGPIMAALSGASVGGAIGGLTGALVGLGIPEYEAAKFGDKINEGGILVSVHAPNDKFAKKAREIFKRCGAEDISEKSDGSAKYDERAENRPVY